ncbi:MAG: T9SS type A sorting domain-containing protein [Bacteroidales bacterium]|nr:T9SS type A sorting domain-containing protein [Bacteroidales bacterium]
MKKLLIIALLAISFMAQAQTITIGEGSGMTAQVPFNTFYNYSFTEQLFLASEIEFEGYIKAVKFRIAYSYNSEHSSDIVVYMKNVSRNTFANGADFEPVTEEDMVFSGSWTIPAHVDDWITITFDTPFHYNGTDNLLIAIDENSDDYAIRYFKYSVVDNSVLSYGSDTDNPNPYDLGSFSGMMEVGSQRANIKLVFGSVADVADNKLSMMAVHPNPANDFLIIDGADGEIVSVYDVNGRLLIQEIYHDQLKIGNLESGLYVLVTSKGRIGFLKEK